MTGRKTKSFTQSVIILLAAQIIVKVLGMLYRMVITNMDGGVRQLSNHGGDGMRYSISCFRLFFKKGAPRIISCRRKKYGILFRCTRNIKNRGADFALLDHLCGESDY